MGVTVPDEVAQLLTDEPVVAHLATCRDGRPPVAPLWFRYVGLTDVPDDQSDEDREVIEIMTTGRKLADLRANPRVALSVQQDEDGHPNWRVVLRGTATVIEDSDETRAANRAINRRYGADDPDAWLDENTLVRVAVGSVSHETY